LNPEHGRRLGLVFDLANQISVSDPLPLNLVLKRSAPHASIIAITSEISQSLSVTPAVIAGVIFTVWWMPDLKQPVQRDGVGVVLYASASSDSAARHTMC
jgi:hypothetical protein